MICPSCRMPMPPREVAAYRDKCEDCWVQFLPSKHTVQKARELPVRNTPHSGHIADRRTVRT